jgi:YbgC/YbaW family acyl-CoA thioester hydrolase
MSAARAAAVLGRLDERGIVVWLEGGWGIDALLGRQTREHDDLDVIVPMHDLRELESALRALGYRHGFAGGPLSFEVVDEDGRQIDVHPASIEPNGDAVYLMEDGREWTYPRGSLSGSGSIAGNPVKCLAPDMALVCHSQGYALDRDHRRDVEALCRRFDLTMPQLVEAFPFTTQIRVRFAETDAQGVAHNASYLVWFEVARVEYLERFAHGYPALREHGVEAFVTEAHVRYGVPARFDDRLELHARCVDVRGARFRFEYRLERGCELVAVGWTAHACVDAATHRPTRVPAWLADAIDRAEAEFPSSS